MNISIIGGGSWGVALANLLSDNKHQTFIYDNNEKVVDNINNKHYCYQLDEYVNDDIIASSDIRYVIAKSRYILLTVPTSVLREVLRKIREVLTSPKVFINCSKGIEPGTFKRMSEVISEEIPSKYLKGIVSLTGPSHAEEVIVRNLTTIVSCSKDEELAKKVQHIFYNPKYFRVYSSTDLVGSEIGGSIKNVYAIASGLLNGCGIGDNGRAALITRSLVEMRRFYKYFKASDETLFGLTGLGDLIVTTSSKHSRNYQAGFAISSNKDYKKVINSMTMVVEGIRTCEALHELSIKEDIDAPILNAVYDIVYLKKNPKTVINKLLQRELKSE